MKHIKILVVIALLLGSTKSEAQLETAKNDPTVLKDPLMPRKKGNDEYKLAYVRDTFLIGDGSLNVWWRDNAIATINEAYAAKGSSRRLDLSNIDFMRKRITYDYKDIGVHMNSGLQDKNPVWIPDNDGFSGNFGVFRDEEEGVVVILFKTQCLNLVKVPQKVLPPKAPQLFARKPDIVDTVRTAGVTVINNIYNNNSIENSGNSSNTNTNTVSTPASSGTEYVIGNDEPSYQPRPRRIAQPICYDCPVMPRQRMYVEARLNINRRQQQQYHPQQPTPPRGYMGGGRSGSNQGYMGGNGNQGGGRSN